jgi:hypothetical protein
LYKNDTIQPLNSVRANVAANWSAIVSNNGCFYISNIQSTTKANQPPAPIINLHLETQQFVKDNQLFFILLLKVITNGLEIIN